MTPLFWQLFVAAVLTFGLVAYLTVRVLDGCLAVYRRWACRREMARREEERLARDEEARFLALWNALPDNAEGEYHRRCLIEARDLEPSIYIRNRRAELDGAATAQDKAERRLVH